MFVVWFLMKLLDWPLSLLMPHNKKKRLKRLKLPIAAGTLAILEVCSAFYFQPKASICSASPFRHSEETLPESPSPKWALPIPDHPAVDTWVTRFSERDHRCFQTRLDRGRFYAASAQEIFVRKGLPKDLIYVALIESGFCPTARSHAKAVGIWQIVSNTAIRFGLAHDEWVDERRHPIKAAQAAADYLSLLYDRFGSWSLALAAYNAGGRAVHEALEKSGLQTFWDLMENGLLPAETCDYVPKVFAAVKIVRNPDLYGFRLESECVVAQKETVPVPGGLKLSWLGKLIGVPERLLENYNPELCRATTPPKSPSYELCLPTGKKDDLLTCLARYPRPNEKLVSKVADGSQPSAVKLYMVKRGDSWSTLARKNNCSVPALASLNGMKASKPLKAGQALKLPRVHDCKPG
jgi:membrane-bound lytic murein transglycosylase D